MQRKKTYGINKKMFAVLARKRGKTRVDLKENNNNGFSR